MSRRSVFVLATTVLAVTAASGYFLYGKGHTHREEPLSIAAPSPGRESVVHVKWHESSTARLPEGATAEGGDGTLKGTLDLEADLVLTRERTTDDHDAIRAELRDVRTAHVVVSGAEVAKNDDASNRSLENKPIHFVVEDGTIARVLVDKNAASLTVQLVENAARQVLLQTTTSTKDFDRDEQLPAGTLRVHYSPRGGGRFDRSIASAVALKGLSQDCHGACVTSARGEGNVELDGDRVIKSLIDRHEVHAGAPGAPVFDSAATFEAERTREGDAVASAGSSPDENHLASKLVGEPFENDAEKHASLVRLANGASMDEVVSVVSSGSTPKGWLMRSSAFLELHPELLNDLGARFEDDGLGRNGRLALLDLLAATGGEAAQATLVRVLDTSAARDGETRFEYVQRLVLVDQPTAQTAASLRERFNGTQGSSDQEMAYAEAHVLGSVANKLDAQGQHGEAKATVDVVAKALDAAKTPDAQAAYLGALGNAGSPAQVSRIVKHARDEDAGVRRAVASALRKTNDDESKRTLISLAKDADEEVEIAALSSIATQPIGASEQRQLASLLDTPQLSGEAESQLTTMLLRQGPPSAEVQVSLGRLLARTEDPRLAAQIRFAMEVAAR